MQCTHGVWRLCVRAEQQGGDVTFVAIAAHNLPNLDGPGGATDAYFRVTIGHITKESSTVSNNNSPHWPGVGEDIHFGLFTSGEDVTVELWNGNGGFLGGDKLIGSATSHVIACNQYMSDQCEESTRLSFDGSSCYLNNNVSTPDPNARCMEFGFRVRSFRVVVTYTAPSSNALAVQLGVANAFVSDADFAGLGRLFAGGGNKMAAALYTGFKAATGGIIVQVRDGLPDKDFDTDKLVQFTVDQDCTVFIFRTHDDNLFPLSWLSTWQTSPTVRMQLTTASISQPPWEGYYKSFPAGSTITLPGNKYGLADPATTITQQYAIIVKFTRDQTPAPAAVLKKFDRSAFADLFWQFLFGVGPLLAMVIPFVHKLRYR